VTVPPEAAQARAVCRTGVLFGFRCNTIRLGLETDHHIHLLVRDYNLPLREK
jgi:hypothetical protein